MAEKPIAGTARMVPAMTPLIRAWTRASIIGGGAWRLPGLARQATRISSILPLRACS